MKYNGQIQQGTVKSNSFRELESFKLDSFFYLHTFLRSKTFFFYLQLKNKKRLTDLFLSGRETGLLSYLIL